MRGAIDESKRRRDMQDKFNQENNIIPKTVTKSDFRLPLNGKLKSNERSRDKVEPEIISREEVFDKIKELKKQMLNAAEELEFEKAAGFRDRLKALEDLALVL